MFLSNHKSCLDIVLIAGVMSVFALHITATASMPHYHDSTTQNQGILLSTLVLILNISYNVIQ